MNLQGENKTIFQWKDQILGRKNTGLKNILNFKVYNIIVIPKNKIGRFSISFIDYYSVQSNMEAIKFLYNEEISSQARDWFSSFKEIDCKDMN